MEACVTQKALRDILDGYNPPRATAGKNHRKSANLRNVTVLRSPENGSHGRANGFGHGCLRNSKKYLIWSNEHRAWWDKSRWGFVELVEDAGRYGREEALNLCLGGMPGHYEESPVNDVPVRLEDMQALMRRFTAARPDDDDDDAEPQRGP
jgi:hypothetical protein